MSMQCINHVKTDSGGILPDKYRFDRALAIEEHYCDECSRAIDQGESYIVDSGIWGGDFLAFRSCSDCHSVRNSFFCSGYTYGRMWDDLENHIIETEGEISEIHISCLTPAARAKVCDMIEQEWAHE